LRAAALRLRFAGILRFAAPALRLAARAFGGRPGFAFALVFAFGIPLGMAESSSRW
jgi:hypothetical protein